MVINRIATQRMPYIEFRDVVKRTVERGGKVIVPAFAVGRTQELVYNLNEMMEDGDVPSVPVYVDSPLAVNATQVFKNHLECFDEETAQFVRGSASSCAGFQDADLCEVCGGIQSFE